MCGKKHAYRISLTWSHVVYSLQYWDALSVSILLIIYRFSTASETRVGIEMVETQAINLLSSIYPFECQSITIVLVYPKLRRKKLCSTSERVNAILSSFFFFFSGIVYLSGLTSQIFPILFYSKLTLPNLTPSLLGRIFFHELRAWLNDFTDKMKSLWRLQG